MAELVISALMTAFFVVRIFKGPWIRHPQYVAASMIGAVVVTGLLMRFAPDMEGNLIVGSIAGFVGAWAGILGFDLMLSEGTSESD